MPLAWSTCVLDESGGVLEEVNADLVQPTASVGKVFLLCEVAEGIASGAIDPARPLRRDPESGVADSGLWQHLAQDVLPLVDVCTLIGAVSDNWATNVLLEVTGLEAVARRALALGCTASGMHDRVRDRRTAEDPPTLSTGTARELAGVAWRIRTAASGGTVAGITPSAARLVERWLLAGVDLSMVAAPCRLDPLAHADGSTLWWSKTGTDTCVRADVGAVWNAREAISYAAIATWQDGDDVADVPFERMHGLGSRLASRMW